MTQAAGKPEELLTVPCMCGATLNVPVALVGKKVKCKRCGAAARVDSTERKARPSPRAAARRTAQSRLSTAPASEPKTNWVWRIGGGLAVWGALAFIGNQDYPSREDQSAPGTASNVAPSASAFSPEPSSPFTDLSAEINTDRVAIKGQENEIQSLDLTLSMKRSDLESMEARLGSMEAVYGSSPVDQGDYENLRLRYNREVDDYNMTKQRRQSLYQVYSTSIDDFNARVDSYNSSSRR